MPEDQNSGGFYLALLKKNGDLVIEENSNEMENEEIEKTLAEQNEETENEPKKDKKSSYQVSDDVKCIPLPGNIWDDLKNEFGISDDFPKHLLFVPSEKYKAIYLITPQVANYLKNDTKSALKLIIFGSVMFQKTRNDSHSPNSYRISQSGIRFLRPFMNKNVVSVSLDEFKFFISCNGSVSSEGMKNEKSICGDKFIGLQKNSYCLSYQPSEEGSDEELFMVSKMPDSICIMVPKEDVAGYKIKYSIE